VILKSENQTSDRDLNSLADFDNQRLREKSKQKLFQTYLSIHGRNLTLLHYPRLTRLILLGLPSLLRGEFWEILSGSSFQRFLNPGEYEKILEENQGRRSLSTDEIEKDLKRSLPEYKGYQTDEGIDKLRRVLVAYSWKNPKLGYCQAMNLIAASFLMYAFSLTLIFLLTRYFSYQSEEQCFHTLSVLCDQLLPGYYTYVYFVLPIRPATDENSIPVQ
jgi:TBC1 domain family member 8/9